MRIFLSCLQSARRHNIPAHGFWEMYFKRGLEEAGHTWVESTGIDWAEGLACVDHALSDWKSRTWEAAVSQVAALHRREPIDMFLSYLFPTQIDSAAVAEIRSLGIPCVNFFCDNAREFTQVPKEFHAFDMMWISDHGAQPMYRRSGLDWLLAPMPAWVSPEHRKTPLEETAATCFIGSHDAWREALFSDAIHGGARIEIYGPGWERRATQSHPPTTSPGWMVKVSRQLAVVRRHGANALMRKMILPRHVARIRPIPPGYLHPTVSDEEYIAISRNSRVTVGVNRFPSFRHPFASPPTFSRLRDLEAPMLGACYLTEWAPGLDDLYDLGKEIEVYRNAEEMVEKLKRLEADKPRRQSLRTLGQRRALAEHTVGRSIQRIADALGIRAASPS